jgi:Replication-relaxation
VTAARHGTDLLAGRRRARRERLAYESRSGRRAPDRVEGGRDIAFLLEYDTGSEHLPQLAGKLLGYADLAPYPAYLAFRMPIVFCFPTPRREQTAR